MPSPVTFDVSLASFPANAAYTPAELAQAIVDRLTIAPQEPWSSFQNGGAIPASDVGPVLYQGREWRVWNPGTGAYTYHTQNGAGIASGTVPFSALATLATNGAVVISSAAGAPTLLPPDTNGQVLTLVGGVPMWVNTFVPAGQYFDVRKAGAGQGINVTGTPVTVAFNTTLLDPHLAYDGTNYRMPVTAGEVWFVYASVQLSQPAGAITTGKVELDIRRDGVATNGLGATLDFATVVNGLNLSASGILSVGATNYFDVGITITATGNPDVLDVDSNVTNTRFGGYRII